MIYLDTHVAAALNRGEQRTLSRRALAALEREVDIRVSPMVLFELEFLREIRRVKVPAMRIIQDLSDAIGLRICDASFADVIVQAIEEAWTRDPFDRIIVAQARLNQATLITRDAIMRKNYKLALD